MESARTLAEKVEAEYTTDLQAVSKDAKLYIVSLKDDALVDLLPQITEGKQASLLVHTAGSIPMSVWEGHAERYGVFYPMLFASFSLKLGTHRFTSAKDFFQ